MGKRTSDDFKFFSYIFDFQLISIGLLHFKEVERKMLYTVYAEMCWAISLNALLASYWLAALPRGFFIVRQPMKTAKTFRDILAISTVSPPHSKPCPGGLQYSAGIAKADAYVY
jgi:hypothetical protein